MNKPNFRIAMREEGDCWNCYIATLISMEGSALIGHLSMALAQHPELRDRFIAVMTRACEIIGGEVFEATPAPEHERSGNA